MTCLSEDAKPSPVPRNVEGRHTSLLAGTDPQFPIGKRSDFFSRNPQCAENRYSVLIILPLHLFVACNRRHNNHPLSLCRIVYEAKN
jgi:hypothetical protein